MNLRAGHPGMKNVAHYGDAQVMKIALAATNGEHVEQRLRGMRVPAIPGIDDVNFRGGRELPIAAQYIGATLEVPPAKMLALEKKADGKLGLSLYDKHQGNE